MTSSGRSSPNLPTITDADLEALTERERAALEELITLSEAKALFMEYFDCSERTVDRYYRPSSAPSSMRPAGSGAPSCDAQT